MSSKELKYCFQNVSAERLRSLIDTICDVSDETRAIFEQELLTQEQGATLRKTKPGQPRYLKCENCEKEFDVTEKRTAAITTKVSGTDFTRLGPTLTQNRRAGNQ